MTGDGWVDNRQPIAQNKGQKGKRRGGGILAPTYRNGAGESLQVQCHILSRKTGTGQREWGVKAPTRKTHQSTGKLIEVTPIGQIAAIRATKPYVVV